MAATVDLDNLATIWVERWITYGGGLLVDGPCDNPADQHAGRGLAIGARGALAAPLA